MRAYVLIQQLLYFNPQQVWGVAATTDTHRRESITDERAWQGFVFPYNVCWFCNKHQWSSSQLHRSNQLTFAIFFCILSGTGAGGVHLGYDPLVGYCNGGILHLLTLRTTFYMIY